MADVVCCPMKTRLSSHEERCAGYRVRLLELSLWNFRNYSRLELQLGGDLFLLVGANAQGKTNLLEAIGLLVTGRSPRTARHRDLIRWGEAYGGVKARVQRRQSNVEIEVRLRSDGPRTLHVHGKPVSRTSQLMGQVNAVFFFPDDLQMVKGSPSLRRRFIDFQLAQVSGAYRDRFTAYQRVLRQRNALFADGLSGRDIAARLPPWDEQLISLGSRLMAERAEAIAALSERAGRVHAEISGGREALRLSYRPFWLADPPEAGERIGQEADVAWWEERFRDELNRRRGEEIRRRTTLLGPQRDDIEVQLDERPARTFASQGQQRTVVLACKLAELGYLAERTGEFPLLLLDDVFSELDARRRRHLLEAVGSHAQAFLTSTSLDVYEGLGGLQARIFDIEAGQVRERGHLPGISRLP